MIFRCSDRHRREKLSELHSPPFSRTRSSILLPFRLGLRGKCSFMIFLPRCWSVRVEARRMLPTTFRCFDWNSCRRDKQ
ncbi:hypothetical protein MPTK1_1g25945 [Marchantia polymorpha subsp. ruderalis]